MKKICEIQIDCIVPEFIKHQGQKADKLRILTLFYAFYNSSLTPYSS